MKYTEKALIYFNRLPEKFKKNIPDSIYLITAEDTIPPGVDAAKCIVVVNKLDIKEVINLANSSGVGHIVQSMQENFEQEVQIAARMILQPQEFTNSPVAEILGSSSSDQNYYNEKRWTFIALNQKEKIKSEIGAYIDLLPNGQVIKNEALSVVDELFTNALLHSSTDGLSLSELRDVKLDESYPAIMFVAHHDTKFLVGCIDHAGTLNTEKLLRHLWASYRGYKIQSIKVGTGGAGLGCRLILNQCLGFYAGAMQSQRTVICGLLSLDRRLKSMMEQSKNIHLNY